MKLYCQLKGCCSKIAILVRALPNPQPRRHVASSATKTDADGTITYSFGGSASTDVNPPSNITQQSIASPASTTTLTPSQPVGEYPHPAFCQAVLAMFPSADDICSVEEARVLYSANYTFLDVRSAEEIDSEGKILPKMPRVLHIPIVNFAKRYDATKGRKIVKKTVNGRFVAQVEKIVSTKDQGLILVCSGVPSQGDVRSISALNKLREAGYEKVVALKAGYAEWSLKFTNKLERRVVGFVVASGGTSIEQKGGMSSKGSGVSGKSVDCLLQEQLANYGPGGVYSDD